MLQARCEECHREAVKPEDFGIVGDPAMLSDRTYVQAALDTGKCVYLSPGAVYRTHKTASSRVNLKMSTDGQHLTGGGTIQMVNGGWTLVVSKRHDISLNRLRDEQNAPWSNGEDPIGDLDRIVCVDQCTNDTPYLFEHVFAGECAWQDTVEEWNRYSVVPPWLDDVVIRNIHIKGNGNNGNQAIYAKWCRDLQIVGCSVSHTTDWDDPKTGTGIFAAYSKALIQGCRMHRTRHGVQLTGDLGSYVVDNRILAGDIGLYVDEGAYRTLFHGNTIVAGEEAIRLNRPIECHVTANYINASGINRGRDAVFLMGSKRCVVRDNVVKNTFLGKYDVRVSHKSGDPGYFSTSDTVVDQPGLNITATGDRPDSAALGVYTHVYEDDV